MTTMFGGCHYSQVQKLHLMIYGLMSTSNEEERRNDHAKCQHKSKQIFFMTLLSPELWFE